MKSQTDIENNVFPSELKWNSHVSILPPKTLYCAAAASSRHFRPYFVALIRLTSSGTPFSSHCFRAFSAAASSAADIFPLNITAALFHIPRCAWLPRGAPFARPDAMRAISSL